MTEPPILPLKLFLSTLSQEYWEVKLLIFYANVLMSLINTSLKIAIIAL